MIQIKEFVDTDSVLAEKLANEFLALLDKDQFIDVRYDSYVKKHGNTMEAQRSAILVIYRVKDIPKRY